jgi:hypothetical protein
VARNAGAKRAPFSLGSESCAAHGRGDAHRRGIRCGRC